jgi:hypothetical protein
MVSRLRPVAKRLRLPVYAESGPEGSRDLPPFALWVATGGRSKKKPGFPPLPRVFHLIVLVFARMGANGATKQRTNMKTIAIISQKGGAGKTTVAVHLAVAAEQDGLNTALFDLDRQASASSWSDKRGKLSPAVVSAQAARLPSLLEQAVAQSADLVIIDNGSVQKKTRPPPRGPGTARENDACT